MQNIQQILSYLPKLSDQQLQQFAAEYKDQPNGALLVGAALAQKQANDRMRQGAQAQPAPQGPKIADQAIASMAPKLPEETGIGQLPAPNMQGMADGGIVGYAGGGGIDAYIQQIRAEAVRAGMDPDLAVRMFITESNGNPGAVSPKGAVGLGQLMPGAAKDMGISNEDRKDPSKNIPASVGYFARQQQQFGSPVLAAAAYNWGPGNLQKHLAENNGQLNPVGLPKETAAYLTKLFPAGTANAGTAPPAAPTQPPPQAAPGGADRPWYDRYRESLMSGEGQRQAVLGVGDLPYALAGAPVDLATAGLRAIPGLGKHIPKDATMGSQWLKDKATQLGVREPDSADPTSQGMRSVGELGGVMLTNPAAITRRAAGLEAVASQKTAAAEEAARKVGTRRLDPPKAPGETIMVDARGNAVPAATNSRVAALQDDLSAVPKAAAEAQAARTRAAGAANLSPRAARGAEGMRDMALVTAGEGPQFSGPGGGQTASGAPTTTYDDFEKRRNATRAGDMLDVQKPPKADEVIALAKENAPPKSETKGWTGDDWMQFGFALMAGKSPYALQNIGEAGLVAVKGARERAKETLLERQTAANEKKADAYYEAMTAKAQSLNNGPDATLKLAEAALARDPVYAQLAKQLNDPMTQLDPQGVARVRAQLDAMRTAAYQRFGVEAPSGPTIGAAPAAVPPNIAALLNKYQ